MPALRKIARYTGSGAICCGLWILAACGEVDGTAEGGALQTWSLSVEPVLSIGGYGDRDEYLLYGVAGATRLSDGTVVIANRGSSQLKYYGADGTHLRTVGGEGQGPGELERILQLIPTTGDTVMVLSIRPGLTWFTPTGELVRSERIVLWNVGGVECRLGEGNWYALADGSIVTILEDNFYGPECPPEPPSPWRQSGLIGRMDTETEQFDTLAIMPATERNSPNYRVYGKSLVLGFGEDRIYAGDTGSEVILALSLDGDTLASMPTPFEATPIPETAKTEEIRQFSRPDGTIDIGNPYLYPETYPRFGRLLVARTGELWVMAYPEVQRPLTSWRLAHTYAFFADEKGALWRVMSPSGDPVAELRTPPGFFPLEVGEDYILGVSKDELDVETVALYDLIK